ncbi:MAG: hypothetical protein VX335_03085 [Pseudomonadota bacterium]|nr:hypothetical protein [Pseudomonadota bacterium]
MFNINVIEFFKSRPTTLAGDVAITGQAQKEIDMANVQKIEEVMKSFIARKIQKAIRVYLANKKLAKAKTTISDFVFSHIVRKRIEKFREVQLEVKKANKSWRRLENTSHYGLVVTGVVSAITIGLITLFINPITEFMAPALSSLSQILGASSFIPFLTSPLGVGIALSLLVLSAVALISILTGSSKDELPPIDRNSYHKTHDSSNHPVGLKQDIVEISKNDPEHNSKKDATVQEQVPTI